MPVKSINSVAALAAVASSLTLCTTANAQWSVTNLHPAGASASNGYAAGGGQQGGLIIVDERLRASLWSGTAVSWVDLSAFLPAEFTSSVARAISSDGVNTYVVGEGFNSLTERTEALLWTRPIHAPGVAGLQSLAGLFAARRRR